MMIPTPGTLPLILRLAVLGLAFSWSRDAMAWGTGHNDVMRAVIDRMPEDLRATFSDEIVKKAISHFSHYPDSFEPFLPEEVGAEAVTKLKAGRLTKRYDLHHDRGRAYAFVMLVDALREGDPDHTALWIAALSHVTADMAACNHDPLVHTATYGWSNWDLKLPGGASFRQVVPMLDLHASASDPNGGADAHQSAIESQKLEDDQRDAATALVDIMLYGQEGAWYCGRRGVSILDGAVGWIAGKNTAARGQWWGNIGELGAWAVVRTLRDLQVAIRLAKTDAPVELTPGIEAAFRSRVEGKIRRRKLESDALFAPLLRPLRPQSSPSVGVIFEPTWAMNEAMLGFSARVQAAAVARTLSKGGRPYATFDVRHLSTKGFPEPERVPLIILVAPAFRSYHDGKVETFETHLATYLNQGGRLLWIGGKNRLPSQSMGAYQKAMEESADPSFPVAESDFVGARLRFSFDEDRTWTIAHSPRTPAGWQQPFCPWRFQLAGQSDLSPLATIETPHASQIVGAISSDRKTACLPIYALTPYLLEGGDRIESPAEPELDAAGTEILFAVLDLMR